ncbi:hypothetical protein C8R47DRAFT_396251 [Mycena vitilis]|nr:hypothetical protein C8R47DRAFT_396251 [Mycena vitilis]
MQFLGRRNDRWANIEVLDVPQPALLRSCDAEYERRPPFAPLVKSFLVLTPRRSWGRIRAIRHQSDERAGDGSDASTPDPRVVRRLPSTVKGTPAKKADDPNRRFFGWTRRTRGSTGPPALPYRRFKLSLLTTRRLAVYPGRRYRRRPGTTRWTNPEVLDMLHPAPLRSGSAEYERRLRFVPDVVVTGRKYKYGLGLAASTYSCCGPRTESDGSILAGCATAQLWTQQDAAMNEGPPAASQMLGFCADRAALRWILWACTSVRAPRGDGGVTTNGMQDPARVGARSLGGDSWLLLSSLGHAFAQCTRFGCRSTQLQLSAGFRAPFGLIFGAQRVLFVRIVLHYVASVREMSIMDLGCLVSKRRCEYLAFKASRCPPCDNKGRASAYTPCSLASFPFPPPSFPPRHSLLPSLIVPWTPFDLFS